MDIKIKNKDIAVDNSGNIIEISGIEQAIQQINLAAGVKKGSFVYDRNFGSEIHKANFQSENICKELQSLINESLVSLEGVYVTVQSVRKILGRYHIQITAYKGYENMDFEVIIYG